MRGVRTGVLDPIPAASTDVLFADDYTAEQKSLADLLAETEGVFVRRFGGAGDRSEVSIRGSTPSQVVVAIDGVRANSALTGGLDLSRACLPLLERVEVTRGAGSTQHGSGAIGGVVNLVTRAAGARARDARGVPRRRVRDLRGLGAARGADRAARRERRLLRLLDRGRLRVRAARPSAATA